MPLTTRVSSDEKRLDRDAQLAEHFRQRLLEEIDLETIFKLDSSKRRARLEKVLLRLITAEGPVISSRERASLIRRIIDEAVGLGVLEPLLADGSITEIMVNGINDVFVERRGRLERAPSVFRNEAQLYQVIDRIVSSVNRRIDESSPMVDARLEGGERVNIIIPPLALEGPTVTIRRFPRPFRLADLVAKKSINKPIMDLLKVLVEARLSVLVSGGTGTGKTTFLNALSGAIPESERIITIEDDAELSLQQAHVVRLESRPANIEGEGEVTIRDLVKNALRMRPDRIVVGEVRGAEAMDMLQAMNTGHEGSLTTVHANSAEDALVRLETLASMSELDLPVDTLRDQINTALNVIVQLTRSVDGYRHVAEISALLSKHRENYQVATIAKYVYDADPVGDEPGHFEYSPLPESYVEAIRVKGLSVPTEFLQRKS